MELLATFFNTSGFGGVLVGCIVVGLISSYSLTTLWVSKGYEDETEDR